MTVQTVFIDQIVIPEIRSNAIYTSDQWLGFLESVRASGIQYRPCCRQLPDGRIELVDGLHRILAWKELGHMDIEVEVEFLDDLQAMTKHLTANHHRGDADPVGLGRVVKKMHDAGKSYEDIGKVLGYSASTVSKYEGLLALPEYVLDALTQQRIKIGHVQQFARLDDENDIQAAMQFAIQMGWSVEVLKFWVDARIQERQNVYQTPEMGMGAPLQPPPPSPDLAMQRQCLCCGAYDKAEQTVFWQMCHGCADTLRYLKTVSPQPWDAIQLIVQQQEQLTKELADKEAKLKELSEKFIDLSLRLQPQVNQAIPAWPRPQNTTVGAPHAPQG